MRGVFIHDQDVIEAICLASFHLPDSEADRATQLANNSPFVWWVMQEGESSFNSIKRLHNKRAAVVCLGRHKYTATLYDAMSIAREKFEIGGSQNPNNPVRRIPMRLWGQTERIDLKLPLLYENRRRLRHLSSTDCISFADGCELFFKDPHRYRDMWAVIGDFAIPVIPINGADDILYYFQCFQHTLKLAGFHNHDSIMYRLIHDRQRIGTHLRRMVWF